MTKAKRAASTALVPMQPEGSTEVALPADLVGKARNYAAKSRSKRTLQEYAFWWGKFASWCDQNSRESLPASIETLCGFITALADQNLAVNTIHVAVSAVKFRHRSKSFILNTKDSAPFQAIWGGIRRDMALKRSTRRVRPLTTDQLRDILEMMRADIPREARDAAVLALAFVGALRRSEVVGLDWLEMGQTDDEGRLGYLKAEADGLTIVLMKSKASQDTAEDIALPRDYAPLIVKAIDTWVAIGKVKKGEPLFRGVKGRGWSENQQCGYAGVCWHTGQGKWRAQAWIEGKNKNLGYFDDPYAAHVAYCKATGRKPGKPHEGSIDTKRMTKQQIANIVKSRIRQWLVAQNKRRGLKKLTPEEITAMVREYSGHSLRAGAVTAMIEAGKNNHEVKLVSRHKSDSMLTTYFRPVDKRKNWGMKGVAF